MAKGKHIEGWEWQRICMNSCPHCGRKKREAKARLVPIWKRRSGGERFSSLSNTVVPTKALNALLERNRKWKGFSFARSAGKRGIASLTRRTVHVVNHNLRAKGGYSRQGVGLPGNSPGATGEGTGMPPKSSPRLRGLWNPRKAMRKPWPRAGRQDQTEGHQSKMI